MLVFCAFYINAKLFKPLKLLIQNTDQLEKGEKPKTLTISSHDEIGYVLKRFARMSDIIYERTSKLNFQASHDHLTGVLNRTELKPALKHAITTCSEDNKLAVIFIDINKFKKLNDEYGHLIGDKVLIETAKRITSSVRADDDVYRYGADEFVIITHNIAKYRHINAMITHLLACFDNPFVLEQLTLNISLSIGVALAPDHNLDHQELLRLADQAMYHAKHELKNSYHIYNNHNQED
ncbi:diguanylate cyclase [uncultured Pseudoalteromonas sp.]|uniref:diguanylate cyclase domain-containing protein n=1 Tax=uncultured Pseudoalteromonas sp. TaxID=114053 RepID=UPI0025942182|nr:diguanylate cyclase [uncultured Pseudoalteromonas sp.]